MKRYYEIACQNIKLISCTPTRHSQSFHKLSTLCLFLCTRVGATISMTKLNRTAQSLYLQHLIAQSHSLSKSLSNSSSHNETSAFHRLNLTLYLTSTQSLYLQHLKLSHSHLQHTSTNLNLILYDKSKSHSSKVISQHLSRHSQKSAQTLHLITKLQHLTASFTAQLKLSTSASQSLNRNHPYDKAK